MKEIKIGKQIWMGENLNVDKFRNGDDMLYAQNSDQWKQAIADCKAAWCYYDFDQKNGEIYGKLYNGFAVLDARSLAPEGWKIPSDKEWAILIKKLGGYKKAGSILKSTDRWITPDKIQFPYLPEDSYGKPANGSDDKGFKALPSGKINYKGEFSYLGHFATWWSDTIVFGDNIMYHQIGYYGSADVERTNAFKSDGFAVRCLKIE